jgi:Na+:H+ antiporter, NhaA family
VPALIYVGITGVGGPYQHGWAIPAATDIAFALGVLSLLGNRVPAALKAFLLAVAVVDDLGAILIVAFAYTSAIHGAWLGLAVGLFVVMAGLNRFGVSSIWAYVGLGLPLWIAMQNSGVNPTLAGVLTAAVVPLTAKGGHSPLHDAEHAIRPYVQYAIMPIFALGTAGVAFAGGFMSALLHPVSLGAGLGLLLGKPIGITIATLIAAKAMKARLPGKPIHIVGVACIAGIGFTMSLFIGALAFTDPALAAPVRVGVYFGSILSAVLGLIILGFSLGKARYQGKDETDDFMGPDPAKAH